MVNPEIIEREGKELALVWNPRQVAEIVVKFVIDWREIDIWGSGACVSYGERGRERNQKDTREGGVSGCEVWNKRES